MTCGLCLAKPLYPAVNHRLHTQIGAPTAGIFLIAFVPRDVVSCAADCEYGYLFFRLALIERRRHHGSRHRCHGAEHIRSLTREQVTHISTIGHASSKDLFGAN